MPGVHAGAERLGVPRLPAFVPAWMITSLTRVLLCYVDESFTRDHYYIAALLCPERAALSLDASLDAVVATAAASFPDLRATAELHGYDIFQGKGDWAALAKMPRARIGVYDQALAAIAAHPVRIVVEGIHPTSRMRVRDPHSVLMCWILERIDEYADARDELALVIADEPGQHDQQSEYRADLGWYRTSGTGGWKSRRITRVVDTLHFAPSESSRLVQASDLVAFLFHRLRTKSETDPRAVRANARLWSHLADAETVHNLHVWEPGI